jgi:hypothetical protein
MPAFGGIAACIFLVAVGTLHSPLSRVVCAGSSTSVSEISPRAARALEAKIQALSEPGHHVWNSHKPIIITELEANSYLKYRGPDFLPRGIYDPEVHIHADRIAAAADVNFEELNKNGAATSDDWGVKALAGILRGKQRVSANGKLETGNGQGKVMIQDVHLGTTQIPDWLVSALLTNYVQRKFNIDLTKPMALPGHVTRIELGEGRASLYRSPDKSR